MRIIALRGKDHCGKTETFNILYNRILENSGNSTCKKIEGNPIYNDFSDIVNYKDLKIAFFSMGDYSTETIRIIKEYDKPNIDILILASNIKFVKPIKLIEKYNHHLVLKTISTANTVKDQLKANNSDVEKIFDFI